MAKIRMTVTPDEAKALQGLDKLQRKVESLDAKLKTAGRSGRRGGQQISSQMGAAAKQAAGFVAAVTGIGGAVGGVMAIAQQLKREYQNLVRVQREAANVQMTAAEARNRAMLNAPEALAGQLDPMVARVAQETGMKQRDIWAGLGGPLSAKGPATAEQFESAVTTAARLGARTGAGAQYGELASAQLALMPSLNLQTGAQALGWVRQVGVASRVEDVRKQIRMVAPIAASAGQYGFTAEQGAELTATISRLAEDPMGEQSRTATIGLMETLGTGKEILPTTGQGGKVRYRAPEARGFAAFREVQDWWAQASERERELFLQKLPGEKRTKGAIGGLLARDEMAMQYYREAQGAIQAPGAGQAGLVEDMMGRTIATRGGTLQQLAADLEQLEEGAKLEDPDAVKGVIRERITNLARAEGVSDIGQRMIKTRFEAMAGLRDLTPGDVLRRGADIYHNVGEEFLPYFTRTRPFPEALWKGSALPRREYAMQPEEGRPWEENRAADPEAVERFARASEKLERAAERLDNMTRQQTPPTRSVE